MASSINLFEKILVVTEIRPTLEVATGEAMYQVIFGEYISNTPEVAARLNAPNQASFAKKFPVIWLAMNVKITGELPYKVGSKWQFTTTENGTVNLVEA
jgi:hypothetical protein